jgi:hypothetical protein
MTKKPKGWFNEIVIRPVVHVDGYESYEKICSTVADAYFLSNEQLLQKQLRINPKESMYITLYTLFQVGQAKCPAYWVNNDLLSALMQSNLDIEVENLQWAMKTGLFMLPTGVVISPEKRSINAIFWHFDINSNLLYWTAMDGVSFFCRRFKIGDDVIKATYIDAKDFNPQAVTEFNEYLQAIFLRLILIMECRSELVDTTSELVRVNKGFGKAQAQDFYQPLWLGFGYRLKREGTQSSEGSSGSHGTKSVHWRRGFLRNQPYGEGRQQKKLVWIEPVLVMGGKESS